MSEKIQVVRVDIWDDRDGTWVLVGDTKILVDAADVIEVTEEISGRLVQGRSQRRLVSEWEAVDE